MVVDFIGMWNLNLKTMNETKEGLDQMSLLKPSTGTSTQMKFQKKNRKNLKH